ncbi:MAG TPA: 1,4-dihydroxy-6-naphthoate synthase [Chitinophagaceae bacterium]|nr:1,4-dihydroxy-6-naphthoate synthase [Chitinophagaceae bacterium]
MKLTLGFSPCPNDTFIFDALVHQKIDTGGLSFDVVLEDVETLNQWALEGRLDITKLSFPALFRSLENYTLLNAGSALGKGVGPLLVRKKETDISDDDIKNQLISIPGINTTANLLLNFAYPEATSKQAMLFSDIEDFVAGGQAGLGLIIHENRFTYQEKGLVKVADLGEIWEQKMNMPIPLGGIAINQSVKRSVAIQVEELIRKSLEYAFSNYPQVSDYVKQHSQTMSEEVMRQHIQLYVNNYSLDLGSEGKKAIEQLLAVFKASLTPNDPLLLQSENLFL